MNESTKGMSREEWLKKRKNGIGASEIAAILGFSKYQTALDVWKLKTHPSETPIEIEDTEPLKTGRFIEETIARIWEDETGIKLRRDNKTRKHPDIPFLFCHLDRIIPSEGERKTGVCEIKNTQGRFEKDWENGPPVPIFLQDITQLEITGFSYLENAVLFGGFKFERFEVLPDRGVFETILPKLDEFWNYNVKKKVPPAPVTAAEVNELYPAIAGKALEAVGATVKVHGELLTVKKNIKLLDKEKEKLEYQIKLAMGEAESLTSFGGILATWKPDKKGRLDTKALMADHPEIMYEEYENDPSRRFLVKGG